MQDFKTLSNGRKVYSLDGVKSRQTGHNAEIVMIISAKDTGKTFNVRIDCVKQFLDGKGRFVEISRSSEESKAVCAGYFEKIEYENIFPGYIFKTEKSKGYIAQESDNPEWQLCCYFVSLSLFQREKKRTYTEVTNAIFDEFIIDKRDRFHRYLPAEYSILANVLDSIFRENIAEDKRYNLYMMGNACDLTCPYMRHFGIDKPPEFGFTFYSKKHVLLHYVKPWDAQERKEGSFIGRMLTGDSEGAMIFDNEFSVSGEGDISQKSSKAKFAFGLAFAGSKFGIWSSLDEVSFWVTRKIPKDSKSLYALTKKDGSLDYQVISRSEPFLKMLVKLFYARALRYESAGIREEFFTMLDFLGIK